MKPSPGKVLRTPLFKPDREALVEDDNTFLYSGGRTAIDPNRVPRASEAYLYGNQAMYVFDGGLDNLGGLPGTRYRRWVPTVYWGKPGSVFRVPKLCHIHIRDNFSLTTQDYAVWQALIDELDSRYDDEIAAKGVHVYLTTPSETDPDLYMLAYPLFPSSLTTYFDYDRYFKNPVYDIDNSFGGEVLYIRYSRTISYFGGQTVPTNYNYNTILYAQGGPVPTTTPYQTGSIIRTKLRVPFEVTDVYDLAYIFTEIADRDRNALVAASDNFVKLKHIYYVSEPDDAVGHFPISTAELFSILTNDEPLYELRRFNSPNFFEIPDIPGLVEEIVDTIAEFFS